MACPSSMLARVLPLTVCLLAAPLAPAAAQELRRPALDKEADPNDWGAYYDRGMYLLLRDPPTAGAYLQWASRLDPARAEPLYAQWVLYWVRHPQQLMKGFFDGDSRVWSEAEARRAAALRSRALTRNPFVHEGPSAAMYERLPVDFLSNPAIRGWISYAAGRLPVALDQFAKAVQTDPERFGYLRFTRASAFVNLAQFDSAAAELRTLLAQQRAKDEATIGQGYESKELLEYAIGLLHLRDQRPSEAREAFGRALLENAGFPPAHARMGELALAKGDTANALLELNMAVEIDGSDVLLRLGYANALLVAERPAEALKQLRVAVQLAPDYAEPYYALGTALDLAGQGREAVDNYNRFLARATKGDPRREPVQVLIDAINEALKSTRSGS
jgi:tetratricopeptide (TPR) repeat protein